MIRQKSELIKISTYISFIYSALYHLKRTSFNKIIVNCSRCRLQSCYNIFSNFFLEFFGIFLSYIRRFHIFSPTKTKVSTTIRNLLDPELVARQGVVCFDVNLFGNMWHFIVNCVLLLWNLYYNSNFEKRYESAVKSLGNSS